MQEPVFSCWAAKEQMPPGWDTQGAAAGTPLRRRGACPLTCQATASWEISRPDMPSVRCAISEHFFP